MAQYVTDDGICLRVTDFSETSQVVGMFTRKLGLVPMIAKGAKRETKKNAMSGPLDLLTSGEVVFVPAKGAAELALLAKWELVNHRTALRRDLAGLNAAMMCAELTTMLVVAHDPHEALYEELDAALELAGSASAQQRMRGVVSYVKTLLEEAGYGPVLDKCVVCDRAIGDEQATFAPRAGGVVCSRCEAAGGERGTMSIAGRIAVALQRLPRPSVLAASPPAREADAGALARAMEILLSQVEAVTDKRIKTRTLMGSIFQGL